LLKENGLHSGGHPKIGGLELLFLVLPSKTELSQSSA